MTPTLDSQPGSPPPAQDARDWVIVLASGEVDEAQLASFRTWLGASSRNREAFEAERRLWAEMGGLEARDTVVSFPEPAAETRRPQTWRSAAVGLIAACLALVAVFAEDARVSCLADYTTAQGEQRVLELPDGSTVYLNTDTALAVDFTDAVRTVALLRGEALFDVAKNPQRPFRVLAQGGSAEALGTAFVVRSGAEGALVTVTEGVVGVTSGPDGSMVTATAGQSVGYRAGQPPSPAHDTNLAAAVAWRKGEIRIDGLPLDTAIAELDRYRPGRIVLLGDRRYREVGGVFDIEDVDSAAAGLAATHGLTVLEITPFLMVLH